MKYTTMKYTRRQLQWLNRLICVAAAMLFFVLSAQAQVQPTITVSDAVGTNPYTVYTSGQAKRTVNVAWNAGSDYSDCVIYYTLKNSLFPNDQRELGRGHDGVQPLGVTPNQTYSFSMVVYLGEQGQDVRTVANLTVVGNVGKPPSPPSSLGSTVFRPVGKHKARGSAAYLFAINNVLVRPGASHVTITFNGPPNEVPYVAIGLAAPIMKNSEWSFGDNLVGGGFIGPGMVSDAEKAKGKYTFTSDTGTSISNDGLEPGATYYYIIAIPAGAGRPPYQDTGKFTMFSEVTEEEENTGTTSSALTREPVKPIGRVKLPAIGRVNVEGPSGPPRPICDVAREARARNSPAAPGLEEKCRAYLAVKGATIAQVDPIVAEARAAETDVLYQQGFDIATGIFGDPALGAQGNTATGPGSLRIRDSLSAAGQRGFNASVNLHLSRNYKP